MASWRKNGSTLVELNVYILASQLQCTAIFGCASMAMRCSSQVKKKKKKLCVHNDKDYLNHFFSFSLLFSLQNSVLTSSTLDFFFPQISLFLNHAYPTLTISSSTHRQPRLYSSPFFFFFSFFFSFKLACWGVGCGFKSICWVLWVKSTCGLWPVVASCGL